MCGILGTIFNGKKKFNRNLFESSLDLLNSRGPDFSKIDEGNDYIFGHNNTLQNYFVKIERKPLSKGLRGSTRPHFFYQSQNSMATLHTQDGSHRNKSIGFTVTNNEDKYFIFCINPHNKTSTANLTLNSVNEALANKEIFNDQIFSLPPCGSRLLELKKIKHKQFWSIKANPAIKSYLIIADKSLNRISVDHL